MLTKAKDEPPVKYNSGAEVTNTIVGGGSIINGKVENSVLFRRVYIGENSVVRNCLLMEGCYIGNNCVIENVIFDKQTVVSDGKHICGEKEKPFVTKKGASL